MKSGEIISATITITLIFYLIFLLFIDSYFLIGVAVLFGFISLIILLSKLQEALDKHFPVEKFDFKYRTSNFFCFTFLICCTLALLILWEKHTINSQQLIALATGIGVITALLILLVFRLLIPSIYNTSSRRFNLLLCLIIGFPFLTIGLMSHLNISLSGPNLYSKVYTLTDKSVDGEEDIYDAHTFYFNVNEKEIDFPVTEEIWNHLHFGDLIVVNFTKGYFGFDKIIFIEAHSSSFDFMSIPNNP